MHLIKLDTIPSTNDFLKNLTTKNQLENFTVVITEHQTNGKGQMGTKWEAEKGKNLTFSILIKDFNPEKISIFDLNITIAQSIIYALHRYNIPKLSIKWPNDILSGNKKISGILIENIFKPDSSIDTIVGIGMNINQTNFDELPKASSISVISGKEFNKMEVLENIVASVKHQFNRLKKGESDLLWNEYHQNLFKINQPSMFERKDSSQFMGIIKRVLKNGKIEILKEDDSYEYFDLKEIQMLY